MKALRHFPLLLSLSLLGCSHGPAGNPAKFVKPSVAVMKFENRASFFMRWDLGSGTRDVLVDRLMRTGRYHVIERPEIDEVMKELNFQQSGVTRAQNRAALGKIKNVQYLIKGVITDFSHVSSSSANASKNAFSILGGGDRAVVSIVLYVVDVESGEIIASESIEESVRSSNVSVQALYKEVSFGGTTFNRTPLGQAMTRVVERAVAKITDTIAAQRWTPKVASVQPDGSVLLNGGADRELSLGDQFEVMEDGSAVVDPDSGDILGRREARRIASLRITVIHDRYSEARIVGSSGEVKVGQSCRRQPTSQPHDEDMVLEHHR